MLQLVKRQQPSKTLALLSPFIALGLTLLMGALLFWISGKNPVAALYIYFLEPFFALWSLHELAIKAAPLILIGAGLSLAYRANVWNIGAEGQLIAGAIVGSILPVLFPNWQNPLVLPLMLFMGMAGGVAFAMIPALLKIRFNTNEILTSLMLVYCAQLLLDWLVRGVWRNPEGFSFPESRKFHDNAVLTQLWESAGRAHWGFVLALLMALLLWFVLTKTRLGFSLRVFGASPKAARFAGFEYHKMVLWVFAISGAMAGLAGVAEVAGTIGHLQPTISPGYGFTAIIVAFLGRLNPLGAIAAALVLAVTYIGGEGAQMMLGVSEKVVRVFQGLLLFFVLGCDTLIHYRIRLGLKRIGA